MEPKRENHWLYLGLLQQLLLLLFVTNCVGQEDWECFPPCKCKWVSGRKTAECMRQNLNHIPDSLSSEIQSLDLTGNRIQNLHEVAFSQVNLVNLQRLSLRECGLESIHAKAFRGLKIVIEIDLSGNKIKHLYAGTFSETQRLRVLLLNHNHLETLENGLFDNLTFLQRVVLSNNQIDRVGEKTFYKLPGLQTLTLDGNNLSNIKLITFDMLNKLGSLEVHNNPWNCDCHLKKLRDWMIEKKLYTKPTTCKQPVNLAGKMWDEVSSDQFACQPRIKTIIPSTKIVQAEYGDNVTLNCLAVGIPQPQIIWVHRSRVLNNSTRRHSGGSEKGYFLTEVNGWTNLTVPDITLADKGDYACIAQSPGGLAQENVTVVIIGDTSAGRDSIISLPLALGVGVAALLFLLVAMTLCVFYCRRRQMILQDEKNHDVGSLEQHELGEQEKSLIAAVNPTTTTTTLVKPTRRYDAPSITSHGTEMTELNRTLLDNDSVFADGMGGIANGIRDDEREQTSPELENGTLSRSSNHYISRQYPPDLLAFSGIRGCSPTSQASTAPDNSRLLNQHLTGPFGSPSSLYASNIGGGGGFKTLPHNRSGTPYCTTNNGSSTIPVLPRQGYVTIPRRPRAPSWSSGPPTSPTETDELVEPVYDNLGLRTTADGSSVISLNKSPEPAGGSMRSRPLLGTPNQTISHSVQRGSSNIISSPLDRAAPEGAAEWPVKLDDEMDNHLQQQQQQQPPQAIVGSLGRKVPPRPPPKPKKKSANGPLYEDEGEDGTEV